MTTLAQQVAAPAPVRDVPPRPVDRTAYLYDVEVRHVRTAPIRNDFTYRSSLWLVDLDALPPTPRLLARFDARDHSGHPARSLRRNIDTFLAGHGIDLGGGQVRMLTNARGLGHVFNPLTVYWCHDGGTGELRCVVAEVHNTYGGRHRYLLEPDPEGRAEVGKAFYVSPFYAVAGRYRMRLPEPGPVLDLHVTLHPPGAPAFTAGVRSVRRRAYVDGWRRGGTARVLLGRPLPTLLVSARIRWQGIRLYLRGLPVVPRTPRASERLQEHA